MKIIINGIVAARNHKPYVQIGTEETPVIAQMSVGEARQIARDIEAMCARTEADAMILKFMMNRVFTSDAEQGLLAAGMMMTDFRDFRAQLDDEAVEHDHHVEPSTEEPNCEENE